MKQYLDLCQDVLENGVKKTDRTGTGTFSVFSRDLRFDLSKGFPLLTTKKVNFNAILHELLWFLDGDTNIKYLVDNGVNIWNGDAYREYKKNHENLGVPYLSMEEYVKNIKNDSEFAYYHGDLGNVYGKQWRDWEARTSWTSKYVDQIKNVIHQIKTNPDSRRHLVSAWNVGELDQMALPPCHFAFQFYVANGKLSCKFFMRSNDVFLGLPFNIASYALLTHMIAQVCDLEVGELVYSGTDVHIYQNHIEQVKLQLTREPYPLPTIKINPNVKDIDDFRFDDFELIRYQHHPFIKGALSV